jgi:hypothetical protein
MSASDQKRTFSRVRRMFPESECADRLRNGDSIHAKRIPAVAPTRQAITPAT